MKPENKEELLKFIDRELLARKKAIVPMKDMIKIFNPKPSESYNNSAGMLAGKKAMEWLHSQSLIFTIDAKKEEIEIVPNY